MSAQILFTEPGGRWRSVWYGPLFCFAILVVEWLTGPSAIHWVALAGSAVVLAGVVALQVTAARTHASVELSETMLRQGTEELPIEDIVAVLPAADPDSPDTQRWESARVLGELSGVPRRRTAIGLRLVGGGLVRAWARNDEGLRGALVSVLQSRPDRRTQ
ncbi:hypothetical protein DW322_19505 [Rhodococcus rhodnii]|uniref:Uncharacterized protein n=2 Tax=Rhodococcus rhodnii TaxID=38312 RepID=R7WPE4_9NOCA|nr:hypothetical protein [Rhodococcus rhodnii]EOM77191.1 hypothetical protein Rrhod_1439 [Rhodococcus rhodnii LMG 5362]TXG91964.1 hypothetical protein DW322_19505 [Rhodococcus rhodnii]